MTIIGRRTLVIVFLSLAAGLATAAEPEEKSVKLTIDYGDGVQKVFVAIPWKTKLTVLAALQAAEKHPRVDHSKRPG